MQAITPADLPLKAKIAVSPLRLGKARRSRRYVFPPIRPRTQNRAEKSNRGA
jgi:hypothetical protein